MSANTIIVNAPELRSINMCFRDWMLTILLWGFWLLVCRHLLLFFGWVIGIYDGVLQINAMLELRNVVKPLMLYAFIAAVNGTILILWGVLNEFLSTGRNRLLVADKVQNEDLAKFYQIAQADVVRCSAARRLIMHHDSDGWLTTIDTNRSALH